MRLTQEIETRGLKAYEQVRAFEALRQRCLPWIYAGFTVLTMALGLVALRLGHVELAGIFLAAAGVFGLWSALNWKKQEARYVENLRLLGELALTYGDQLPWVQVENHFAALAQLERELAEEKIGAALKDLKRNLEESPEGDGAA